MWTFADIAMTMLLSFCLIVCLVFVCLYCEDSLISNSHISSCLYESSFELQMHMASKECLPDKKRRSCEVVLMRKETERDLMECANHVWFENNSTSPSFFLNPFGFSQTTIKHKASVSLISHLPSSTNWNAPVKLLAKMFKWPINDAVMLYRLPRYDFCDVTPLYGIVLMSSNHKL